MTDDRSSVVQPPRRVTRHGAIPLARGADDAFPLFCPVREREWVRGWAPRLVVSASGVAERDCVFVTADGDREATWVITEHDPARRVVDMVKVVPGFAVTRVRVEVRPAAGGSVAEVTYTDTALADEAMPWLAGRDQAALDETLRAWKAAIDALPAPAAPS